MLHIDLQKSDEEKLLRRKLLDRSAGIAQVSAIAVLLLIGLFRLTLYLTTRATHAHSKERPSSPELKNKRRRSRFIPFAIFARWGRYFSFRLDSPLYLFGLHLGSANQLLSASLWTIWLLFLSFIDTDEDYIAVTKRFGIVGASQLPLLYVLAIKSPINPVTILTGQTWEQLNGWHQMLGRIIILFFAAHGLFYLNLFFQIGNLSKRLLDLDVLLGLSAIVLFTTLATTALGMIRRASYRLFIALHVLVAVTVLPIAWFHVSHIRIYILESVVIYICGMLLRVYHTRRSTSPTLVHTDDSDLIEITTEDLHGKSQLRSWQPGQHFYLVLQRRIGFFPTSVGRNPFSAASLPADGRLKLVARIAKRGNTAALARAHSRSTDVQRTLRIEGPYGPTDHLSRLGSCDRVLLLAGGVGGTFTWPLFRALLDARTTPQARARVELVWVVRALPDLDWALKKHIAPAKRLALVQRLRVHVTASDAGVASLTPADFDGGAALGPDRDGDGDGLDAPDQDGLEMVTPLLSADARTPFPLDRDDGPLHQYGLGLKVVAGRPDVAKLVSQVFAHDAAEKVGVYVCGPAGMGRAVRREVGRHVAEGRDVLFWSEEFGIS